MILSTPLGGNEGCGGGRGLLCKQTCIVEWRMILEYIWLEMKMPIHSNIVICVCVYFIIVLFIMFLYIQINRLLFDYKDVELSIMSIFLFISCATLTDI